MLCTKNFFFWVNFAKNQQNYGKICENVYNRYHRGAVPGKISQTGQSCNILNKEETE